jgi:hypothetical protein
MYTSWNDAGEQDTWKSTYLDRHTLDCTGVYNTGINYFKCAPA